jgi:hypothetical protein
MRNKVLTFVGAAALAVGGALLITPGAASASAAPSLDFYAALQPVAANHVTGSGGVWISLTGDSAKFTLQVDGLLAGAPHPAQLYVGAAAACPTAGQAAAYNGHPSIGYNSASLGSPQVALTTKGDTSVASALAMPRFPTAGAYTYTRTFDVPPAVAAAVKGGKAVLVVHGVDYNGNGKYDDVLGVTPGHHALPAEATDPALCGTFVAAQMAAAVPAGSADTGGGSTAATSTSTEMMLGGLALLAAGSATVLAFRRRVSGQSAEVVVTNGFRRLNR